MYCGLHIKVSLLILLFCLLACPHFIGFNLFFWFSSLLFLLFYTICFFGLFCVSKHRQTRLVYDNSLSMICFVFLFIGFLYVTCFSTFYVVVCLFFSNIRLLPIWIGSFLLQQFLHLATHLFCVVVATLTIVAFFHFPSPPPPCISFLHLNFCCSRCLHLKIYILFVSCV